MIRGAILHLQNEQPLVADIERLPTPQDACLICTNLRTTSGSAPRFIESSGSTFLFPLSHIRFVEIPAEAAEASDRLMLEAGPAPAADEEGADLELDEDFLRRVREAQPAPAEKPAASEW